MCLFEVFFEIFDVFLSVLEVFPSFIRGPFLEANHNEGGLLWRYLFVFFWGGSGEPL